MDGTGVGQCRHVLEKLYGNVQTVDERHRHRYEVNLSYVEEIEKAGMKFVGRSDDNERMEIVELDNHPYFVAVQYHPEYISRPLKPSAPYLGLIWVGLTPTTRRDSHRCVASFSLKAACGELNSVLAHVTQPQTAADTATKSPGPFSHVNLFRHT